MTAKCMKALQKIYASCNAPIQFHLKSSCLYARTFIFSFGLLLLKQNYRVLFVIVAVKNKLRNTKLCVCLLTFSSYMRYNILQMQLYVIFAVRECSFSVFSYS